MATTLDTRQSRNRAALPNIGSAVDTKLDVVLGLVDTKLGSLDGDLDAAMEKNAQDRSIKIIEGGLWKWTLSSNALSLSANAYIQVPGLEDQRNTIALGTMSLAADGDVAYVTLVRSGTGPNVLAVSVGQIDTIVLTEDVHIIARRIGDTINIGNTFSLKDGEILELDGALAEINRYFGQLQIKEHPTNKKRVIITGTDTSKLDGTILNQTIRNLILKFDGAEIDFNTGNIYENDGATILGINFTPFDFTGKANEWYHYSIALIASTVNADSTINGQILIVGALDSAPLIADAPKAAFGSGGLPIGQVAIQNDSLVNATAVEDILQSHVMQLGIGGSGGSGSGDASSLLSDYKITLSHSIYDLLSYNIFDIDGDEKVAPSTTASINYASSPMTYKFATGETLVCTDLLDPEFIDAGTDIMQVDVQVNWADDAIDTAAIYEISKDGGTTWEVVNLARIGVGVSYIGTHTFSSDLLEAIHSENNISNWVDQSVGYTDTVSGWAQLFTPSEDIIVNKVNGYFVKSAATTGTLKAALYDTSGINPGNLIIESSTSYDLSTLADGDLELSFDFADAALDGGTPYNTVFTIDGVYVADALSAKITAGGGLSFYTTAWGTSVGSSLVYQVIGVGAKELIVKVTASQDDVLLQGFGVYYDPQPAGSGTEPLNYEKFVINTATNVTEFTLSSFIPTEELLECHILETGQVFKADNNNTEIMSIEGMKITFPNEHFYDLPGYNLTVVFSQNTGQIIDFNENNSAMISENHLGSESPSLDRSVTGRGVKIRNAAGILREITLDENDNIVINSLP